MNLSIPAMSLKVRKFIGGFLRKFDEKIELNIELAKILEETVQTVFKSWFVAGEKPFGMEDSTAALFPDSLVDSELGLIPTGWSVKSLFDIGLEIESGSRPKGGVKGISKGIPSVGAESINGIGVFDFTKTKYIPEDLSLIHI